jgi:hypothetical protein
MILGAVDHSQANGRWIKKQNKPGSFWGVIGRNNLLF